jgi:hypothetical protein
MKKPLCFRRLVNTPLDIDPNLDIKILLDYSLVFLWRPIVKV